MIFTKPKNSSYFFNPKENLSLFRFSRTLSELIDARNPKKYPITFICVGTDRATGDSLGPIIGYKLKKYYHEPFRILGTLENPIHAKNLSETIEKLHKEDRETLLIAIDACLGRADHIGMIHLGEGPLSPGAGVNKVLPPIGDIFITGVVNFSGPMDLLVLQNTRLNTVMELADFITLGIMNACLQLKAM